MLSSRKRVRVELPNEAVLCRCALHYLGSRKATAVTTLAYAKGLNLVVLTFPVEVQSRTTRESGPRCPFLEQGMSEFCTWTLLQYSTTETILS